MPDPFVEDELSLDVVVCLARLDREVCTLLRVSDRTLRRMVAGSPPGVAKPWISLLDQRGCLTQPPTA